MRSAKKGGPHIVDRNESQTDLKNFMYSRQKTDPDLFRWNTAADTPGGAGDADAVAALKADEHNAQLALTADGPEENNKL